ncbi:sensor histidine kinase [Dyadobacter psychrophilus]|uniref:Histidine kinase n=1 Tax=Dyadobacter psychrophilus TaxID=651661 RepID=A0A1T5HDA0_9BACT|nr:histidine kinase [Dyadobacter psychrophilus]SKC18550.1 Histidine kinase [Dyadobacter psychrophilus]
MQASDSIASLKQASGEPFSLIFPKNGHTRLLMHVSFWTLFVISHLLYFWPLSYQIQITRPMLAAYGLYYLRYIPVFYGCMLVYHQLRGRLGGFQLWFSVLVASLIAIHLSTLAMFYIASVSLDIEHAAPAFQMLWRLYMESDLLSRKGLFMVFYDFEDLQLLLLPASIKVFKTAIINERIRMQIQKEGLLAEINSLKAQLSPHLIFNLLNAAYAELLPFSHKAASYLASLSSVMRYTLYKGTQHAVALKEEIGCLKDILALESARSQSRSKISYKQLGRIKPEHQVPALLLVSLAENAIKHGVHDSYQKSYVRIKANIQDDTLHFYIINSLPQLPESDAGRRPDSGIGLNNIVRRLKAQYPKQHSFTISKNESSFAIDLTLPLRAKNLL